MTDGLDRYELALAARNQGKTYSQIAEMLGVSRQRVGRILNYGPPKKIGRPRGSKKQQQETT